jgi:hypothetical protein
MQLDKRVLQLSQFTNSLIKQSNILFVRQDWDIRHGDRVRERGQSPPQQHNDEVAVGEVRTHRLRGLLRDCDAEGELPGEGPFRLTRLLANAPEVSRIERTYRHCCENVLRLLRDNDYQIMGLLESFIYDPLLQRNDPYSGKSGTKRSLFSGSLR